MLTGILFPITRCSAPTRTNDPSHYYFGCWCSRPAASASSLALDLFLFFVFFEIVLVPMYFLIGQWGYGNRTYAALKFFLYTMFGSAFMLVAHRHRGAPPAREPVVS